MKVKVKPVAIFLLCALLGAFLLGISGAVRLVNTNGQPNQDPGQLIGVLITRAPLDFEEETPSASGRLSSYQTDTARNYEFENVEGIRFFAPMRQGTDGSYRDTVADTAIADQNLEIRASDLGESLNLEGTLYLSTRQNQGNFYFYPVYQTAAGEVYAAPGDGVQPGVEKETGNTARYEIRQTRSSSSANSSSTGSAQLEDLVQIHLCYLDEPSGLSLLHFDGEHRLLSQTELEPGKLPESFTPLPETRYLILETAELSPDQLETVSRTLYGPEEETLSAFYTREDGLCIRQECQINWEQGEASLSLSCETETIGQLRTQ